jgi:hypothetical protein
MNKILNKKINNNLTQIIGSYLLSNFKKIDIGELELKTGIIKHKLDNNFVYSSNENFNILYCPNFNNCKIVNSYITGFGI